MSAPFASAAGAAAAAPVRIMPLGDSITGSPGCWRALLWDRLQKTGYTGIELVGTLGPQGCGIAHDGDNEGHGGIQTVSQAWGGTATQSGSRVTIAGAAWNGALAAGASATAGFIGSWTGTNALS